MSTERPQPESGGWGRQGLYSPAPLLSLASCGGKQRKQRLLGRQEVSFQNAPYSQLKAGGEESRWLHLSGCAPQNGLTFKGKVYELPAGPQSHLLAERGGCSPEGLGQRPRETRPLSGQLQPTLPEAPPTPIFTPLFTPRSGPACPTPAHPLSLMQEPQKLQSLRLLVHSQPSLAPTDTLPTL